MSPGKDEIDPCSPAIGGTLSLDLEGSEGAGRSEGPRMALKGMAASSSLSAARALSRFGGTMGGEYPIPGKGRNPLILGNHGRYFQYTQPNVATVAIIVPMTHMAFW